MNWFIEVDIRCMVWILGGQDKLEADRTVFIVDFYGDFTSQLNTVYLLESLFSHSNHCEVSSSTLGQEL